MDCILVLQIGGIIPRLTKVIDDPKDILGAKLLFLKNLLSP